MKKFLIVSLLSTAILAETSFYDLLKSNQAATKPEMIIVDEKPAVDGNWLLGLFGSEKNSNLSNLLGQYSDAAKAQPKKGGFIETINSWFNPQTDTRVTEIVKEKMPAQSESWLSKLVHSFSGATQQSQKPAYTGLANMLFGGKDQSKPTTSNWLVNEYLDTIKKPGALENMLTETKELAAKNPEFFKQMASYSKQLMQSNPGLFESFQNYLTSNPQVLEQMGQFMKNNPNLVQAVIV